MGSTPGIFQSSVFEDTPFRAICTVYERIFSIYSDLPGTSKSIFGNAKNLKAEIHRVKAIANGDFTNIYYGSVNMIR